MDRKPLTTSIDEDIQKKFKAYCKQHNLKMNLILETFMKGFSEGKFEVTTEVILTVKNQEEIK